MPDHNTPEYQNITMDIETALRLTDVIGPGEEAHATPTSLGDQYNLSVVFKLGVIFDQSQDLKDLQPIMDRLQLKTLQQTRVLWEYLKYIRNEFATFGDKESGPIGKKIDGSAKAQLSTFISNQIYEEYFDLLHLTLSTKMMIASLTTNNVKCTDLIKNSSPSVDDSIINKTCDELPNSVIGFAKLKSLIDYCYWQNQDYYKSTMLGYGFNEAQSNMLCGTYQGNTVNDTPINFNDYLLLMNRDMSSHYSCSVSTHCSRREILAYQWTFANVTSNPPDSIKSDAADSVGAWFPENPLAYFKFEIPNFAKYYNQTIPTFNQTEARNLISYDAIISPLSIAKAVQEWRLNQTNHFSTERFYFPDASVFDSYVKYLTLEGFFEGSTIKTTMNNTIFGFESTPLKFLKNKLVSAGGDPTLDPVISIVSPSETSTQVRHTGQANATLNDAFASLNGLEYINYKNTLFNGTDCYDEMQSPWAENVPLSGGDNLFGPRLDKKSTPLNFQTDFFRTLSFKYNDTVKYHNGDLETYRYKIDDSVMQVSDENMKFDQFLYQGAFNLTKSKKAPIFVSKKYFLHANQSLFDKISMVDSNSQAIVQNETDDIMVDINPTAGVPVMVDVAIQINVNVPNDQLFNSAGNTLYPIL